MAIQKLSNLEAYVKEFLTHDVYKKDVRALRRIRTRIQRALDQNCCNDGETPVLGITGPTGVIATGAQPFPVHVESSVTGISDSEVVSISLYINNVFIETQEGNDFTYDTVKFAQTPAVEQVYYTVAILASGQTIVSPILQFTLTQTIPAWSFTQQQQIAGVGQTRHICDFVTDVDPDTVTVTFLSLPSFCTANVISVPGVTGIGGAVIVDIIVSPVLADVNTYTFTMRATDGLAVVDKAVSLQVNNVVHHNFTSRPASPSTTMPADGIAHSLGSVTISSVVNGQQFSSKPDSGVGSYNLGGGPGVTPITFTPLVGVPKKMITVFQSRNNSTGTSGRYEDSLYFIITVT